MTISLYHTDTHVDGQTLKLYLNCFNWQVLSFLVHDIDNITGLQSGAYGMHLTDMYKSTGQISSSTFYWRQCFISIVQRATNKVEPGNPVQEVFSCIYISHVTGRWIVACLDRWDKTRSNTSHANHLWGLADTYRLTGLRKMLQTQQSHGVSLASCH